MSIFIYLHWFVYAYSASVTEFRFPHRECLFKTEDGDLKNTFPAHNYQNYKL